MRERDNLRHLHRHAVHALEDFRAMRRRVEAGQELEKLLHAISHHLRHVVYRSGIEVDWNQKL